MRPIRFGLAALGAVLTGAFLIGLAATSAAPVADKGPPITSEARDAGKKAAPALITAANLPCQMNDARFIGAAPDPKTKKDIKYYEVACTGAIGYILVDTGAPPPSWAACPDQAKTGADGKPNGLFCILPGNADATQAFDALVAKAHMPCGVTGDRGIGHTPDTSYFEVACKNGQGYVLQTAAPPSPDKPVQMVPCLAYEPTSQLACKLTTPAANMAVIDTLAAQAGKNCQVKDRRYVLTTDKLENYYEVACQDGKGYMLHAAADGKLADTIDCAVADPIGGGCTLTNGRAALSEQTALYSTLAHKAGFPCNVSKYGPIPADVKGYEVVELACSNRTDGAIGLFPAKESDAAHIYDCAHSELVGYRCSFTQPDAAFPHLTDDLKKLGKTSCAVSGERIVGETPDKVGYVEVACADGNPGYIVSYALGDMTPKEATTCTFAKGIQGGCQLPGNLKHN